MDKTYHARSRRSGEGEAQCPSNQPTNCEYNLIS